MADITAQDIVNLGQRDRTRTSMAVTTDIDAPVDQAQRALQLSQASGVDASIIYNDQDEFERNYKAQQAGAIVRSNRQLSNFVQSNPMVPKLFNNDYGTLDSLSSKMSALDLGMKVLRAPEAIGKMMFPDSVVKIAGNSLSAMMQPPKGFGEGFGEGGLGSWIKPEGWQDSPLAASTLAVVASPLEGALRLASGVSRAATEEIKDTFSKIDPKLGTDLAGMAEAELMGVSGRGHHLGPATLDIVGHNARLATETNNASVGMWLQSDRKPPKGLLPEYDDYLLDRNKQDVENVGEAIKDAQSANPDQHAATADMLAGYVRQHSDADIGISAEGVAALYGDKVPLAGDGILGDWITAEQVEAAKRSGDDIHVPMSEFVTKVEPDVYKALAEDLRIRPDGITAREGELAKEAKTTQPPPIPLPEAVPAMRAAHALEPLLSIGDRVIKMEKREAISQDTADFRGGAIAADQWRLLDEQGNKIGHLELTPAGKDLMVDMVMGLNGLGPRDFGPALMRSLLRQIKENYPEAERVGGYRVSGAREKAGTEAVAWIKLDALDDAKSFNEFRQVLEGGQWEQFAPNIKAYIKPHFERSESERALIDAVNEEAQRILPKGTRVQVAERIEAQGTEGQREGSVIHATGAYIPRKDALGTILYALEDNANPLGTLHHEAIHVLRDRFTKEEWFTLEKAAHDNDWQGLFNIKERYPTADPALRSEESIADALKKWESGKLQVTPEVQGLFERIKAFLDAIRQRISALLGKDATWEDIFQKVDTGEVGSREGTKPLDARAFDEKLSVSSEPPPDASRVYERSMALGISKETFKRLDKNIQEQFIADMEANAKRISKAEQRTQTKEWKANRTTLRAEVAESINFRPDIAADNYFADGMLYGKKVERVKLDSAALTPEQKASLPRDYYGKDGAHPDDIAGLFGMPDGETLLRHLSALSEVRRQSGMRPIDFKRRVIDIETDRQMRQKYGVLEDNIMDSIKEQVTSESQLRILHEETIAKAEQAGTTMPFTKEDIQGWARDEFNKSTVHSVDSDRYMAAVGRAGNKAWVASNAGDHAAAFMEKQTQAHALALAKEAVDFEKLSAKTEKLMGRFRKPFDPKNERINPTFSLFIRDVLSRLEVPNGMRPDGLAKAIGESGYKDLGDFVDKTNAQYSLSGIELPVADFLRDPTFHKPLDELTVSEFRAVHDTITAMNKFGRDVERVTVEGEKADRADWVKQAGEQLANKFAPQDFGATGKPGAARHYLASLLNMETMFGRFDGRDPNGMFTQMFTYPAARAANNKDVLTREYSKDLRDAGPIENPAKKLASPFTDPRTGQPLTDFTREHLATVISNMGNNYNWSILAKGWKIDPNVLWKWVEANATKADLDRAQAIGKVFDKAKAASDVVYQHMYEVAPENIQVRPFEMHGTQYEGWYHPIIHDPIRSRVGLKQDIDPSESGPHGNFWPSTSNAYTKRRTGYVDVISLDQSMIGIKLNQMLHDIAFREFVHETAKITRDSRFQEHVSTYYGPEYKDAINTWLERIAGNASYNGEALGLATRLSNQMRSNVISTYIAFNPTTIQKHGFTAAVMSAKEVGVGRFAKAFAEVTADSFRHAVSDLFGKSPGLGDSLWQFVRKNSEEIQRRQRNFEDTLGGQMDLHLGKPTLKQKVIELGSAGVAFSDMLSAAPTWLAKYREVLEQTGDVGHATDLADASVRRAHGSTAITNQPLIVSHSNPLSPWLTSIYGFFGTNMQRRFEIAHDINDAYKLARNGEIAQAAKAAPAVMSSIFTYVIWPGLVEEAVTAQFMEDKTKGGLLGHILAFTLGTAASTFIGIRDLAYGLTHNQDPHAGLIESPLHDVSQLLRDVKKDRPFDKHNAGKLVQDAITVFGDFTGKGPKHVGQAARYGIDVLTGEQKPKGGGDIYRGIASGQQERKVVR